MPISHVFAEGIGPFKKVHLDLRGPDGKPSLGPHILAGVNGSGKSTLLKAIAWCLAGKDDGFLVEEWTHFLRGYPTSRVLIVLDGIPADRPQSWALSTHAPDSDRRLVEWVTDCFTSIGLRARDFNTSVRGEQRAWPKNEENSPNMLWVPQAPRIVHNLAAYSSVKAIHYVDQLDPGSRPKPLTKRFGFDSTVQNEAVQSWLLSLYSKRAIAKERHEPSSRYSASFEALERGLRGICGDDVSIGVEIEPSFQPSLRIGSKTLNFSQIPDGIKVTLGWLADFMMRAESLNWDPKVAEQKPGILLFDEIESYLHPLWQRRILPAAREALPNTQMIVTSHSPFVISSCRDAMVHVLKIDKDGNAYAESPVPAPIGESITSTLKEIFGVDSRFDIETEKELGEWNDLNKARAAHKLSSKDEIRFQELSQVLGSRSEELRSLVNPIPKLSKATVDKLTEVSNPRRIRRRRVASR